MSTALSIFTCFVIVFNNRDSLSRAEPIVGWVELAAELEFPFIVSIARKFDIPANNPYGHICGGALITREYVLTAASCFVNDKNGNIIIRDYFVYVGSSDLAQSSKFEIESWISYENWNAPFGRRNMPIETITGHVNKDIAIVRLSSIVASSVSIPKVLSLSPTELEGKRVITAGWGTFGDVIQQDLLKADLKVLKRDQCLQNVQIASNDLNYSHEDNIFCTNTDTLFAVLQEGDKGSPVLIKHQNGSWRIVGINLKSFPPANNITQQAEQQNLHLSVQHFMNFIKKVAQPKYMFPAQ